MSLTARLHAKPSRATPILWGLGVAAAITALVLAFDPRPGDAPAPGALPATGPTPIAVGALSTPDGYHDFGSISMAAGLVKHRYAFTNTSSAPVTIERIYTSCMCTKATFIKGMRIVGSYGMLGHGPVPPVKLPLAPGETGYIDAVFDPAAHGPAGLGRTVREIAIEQSAGASMRLTFAANVRP